MLAQLTTKITTATSKATKVGSTVLQKAVQTGKKAATSVGDLLKFLKREFLELLEAIRKGEFLVWLMKKIYRILGKSLIEEVVFGVAELSLIAIEHRTTLENPRHNGNVAVFEFYDDNDTLIRKAFSTEIDLNDHAEKIGLDWVEENRLNKEKVKRIYTELEPCSLEGHSCKNLLSKNFKKATIQFSFPYPGKSKSSKVDFEKRKKSLKERKINFKKFL